ncbi:MAG: ABC transporter [Candidatus Parabeggiatoa sp. nov. 3]|nr:MAG: ABC transporter [Gammaproteobacteria bacterium]RKZ82223.1 MAG: ABC transporter [Gammaproteobacteria bacterium]HEW98198.1 ABC transporter ATP-binding protein [Beggiatoa sp.]
MINSSSVIVAAHYLSKQVQAPEGVLTILNTVNLTLSAGEAVAILGASGSGKSTLLGLLAGLDSPSSGDVSLFGTNLKSLDEDGRAQLRASQVGFVFQSFHLLPSLTALENVMLPIELAGETEAKSAALTVLEQVGLSHRLHHTPLQLSGGEQQRVAIARAFACKPLILFADEPTGNLDQATGERVIDLLFSLKKEQGTTLVLVTHDPMLAKRCDRHYVLDGGKCHETS